MDKRVISVDIDGVVARQTGGADFNFADFEPIPETIERVNKLYRKGYVIIYHTARQPEFYQQTLAWLVKHGAWFHALRMGKLGADFYVDDRNASLDDLC